MRSLIALAALAASAAAAQTPGFQVGSGSAVDPRIVSGAAGVTATAGAAAQADRRAIAAQLSAQSHTDDVEERLRISTPGISGRIAAGGADGPRVGPIACQAAAVLRDRELSQRCGLAEDARRARR